jgi:hypothetical protein
MAVRVSTCRKMVTLFVKGAESILSNVIPTQSQRRRVWIGDSFHKVTSPHPFVTDPSPAKAGSG